MKDIYDNYKDLPAKLLDDVKKEVSKKKITNVQLKSILERIRKEYEYSKISAGEAIGIITAESFGEPSTQMSVSFFEKIIVRDNFGVRNVEIGKFVDNIMKVCGYSINNFSEITNVSYLDIYVPSLNEKGEILVGKVSEVSRHKFKDKLLKLKTKSGKEITATPYHSFVIKRGNSIVVVSAKDLRIGKELPVIEKKFLDNFGEIVLEDNSRQKLILGNVQWDKIVSIEPVKSSKEYVYDLSVPGLETFTTFQGVITHNTLNVKHFAGVAEMNVTMGLPRLIEIFDARKIPSTPVMDIYLKKEYSKNVAKIRKIAAQIKETVFNDVVTEFSIDMVKMHIKAVLDKDKLKELGMNSKTLLKTLDSSLRNVTVRLNKNSEIILKGKELDLNEVYALKEKAKNVFVKGVKKVSYVLPFKRGNEFIISSAGTNLKDVLVMEGVDETRTISNDLFEIYKTFGIEAARQAIINESIKVIENQGLDIDIRHILFIADAMTNTGKVKGITRSGITGEKESVLARASFETPLRHLINASLIGEEDKLNSVVENVILNQPIPVGTGLPDLVAKMKEKEK